jgi:ParB family chromosome partitioning protein
MSQKPKHMGRGLGSLLPTDLPTNRAVQSSSSDYVPVAQIELNPFQPRKHFDPEALEELAASIRLHGIIQPLTLRKLADRQYQLISGERRLRAAQLAGLAEVPAFIRTANDEQMLEMALIENIQREDLNPIEISLSYQRMIDELGLRQDELGDKVGKPRSTVANYLGLLRLPDDIVIAIRSGEISMGHAKAINGLEDPLLQLRALKEIREKELSVRQAEKWIRDLKASVGKTAAPPAPSKPEAVNQMHLSKVASTIEDKLGSKVKLAQNPSGKGEIVISFNSTEDLNRILELLEV